MKPSKNFFKKMKHLFLLILISMFIMSCATRRPQRHYFYTTTYSQVHQGSRPRDNFMESEIPTIFLYNYNGYRVNIQIVDLDNGRIVYEKAHYIPQEHVKKWILLNNIWRGFIQSIA